MSPNRYICQYTILQMPISQSEQLFQLVRSLSKSEKRSFTLYASRIQDADSLKYMQLFDLIEKEKNCTDAYILGKLKRLDKTQYSNLKRHLFKQIMASLRLTHIAKKTDIEIREYLDFADILYGKGLYIQALKILEKAKIIAHRSNNELLELAILETEKNIGSRHIPKSEAITMPQLILQSEEKIQSIQKIIRFSNARIELHSHYIKHGHVKNSHELTAIQGKYNWLTSIDFALNPSYHEVIYLLQCQVWFYYITLDFAPCLKSAQQWVSVFKKSPSLIEQDADLYMRGYHYVLTCAYNLNETALYEKYLAELESFRDENYSYFNENTRIISFLYVHYGRFNLYFLRGKYQEGLAGIPATLRRIQKYKGKLDVHRMMVLYFKMAWMHLMSGQPDPAIHYLNTILQLNMGSLREDIQGYSHLMFIMAHFDAGNEEILDYLVQGARQYFDKSKSSGRLQQMTITFFQQWGKLTPAKRKSAMQQFYQSLFELETDIFEMRSMLYLDIQSWLSQKIQAPKPRVL